MAVLYGVDAVALSALAWTPRFFCYSDAEARRQVEEIKSIEIDVMRSVVTLNLQRT